MSAAIPMPLTQSEVTQALDVARTLAAAGVPLFTAEPCLGERCTAWCLSRPDGMRRASTNIGYHLPARWQESPADPRAVDAWRPGWALCAVGGVVCDFLDVDPRNGGTASAEELVRTGRWPRGYGTAATPSGGSHTIIAPLGRHKGAVAPGVDYQGGAPDGTGRGFVFIAPTVRASKTDGTPRPYRWLHVPDPAALAAQRGESSGAALAVMLPERGPRPPRGAMVDRQPWDRHFEPSLSQRRAREVMAAKLAEVTEAARAGWGARFRDTLNAAAYALGGLSAGGLEDDVEAALLDAVRAAGHEPDADDARWIEEGLDDGSARPLWVNRPPPHPPAVCTGGDRGPGEPPEQEGPAAVGGRLPEEFWEARGTHRALRDTAHMRACPADAVLGVVLARLSSMVDGSVRVDTGIGPPLALNIFTILLGAPGTGKTSSAGLARLVLPLHHDHDSPEHPLGSGQGLADAYGGVDPGDGQWKQTRHKAFFFADEGAGVFACARQKDSTLLATVRGAWMGNRFGHRNATAERNRSVQDYSMGMWMGLQHSHAAELFSDKHIGDGTLQRFLWFPTRLSEDVPECRPPRAEIRSLPIDLDAVWTTQPVRFPEHLKDELWAGKIAVNKGRVERPVGQEHTDLHKAKVACLLAIMDGRRDVVDDDWYLAGLVLATSAAVADSVRRASARSAQKAEAAVVAKRLRVLDAEATHADVREENRVAAMTAQVAAKVAARPGIPRGELVRTFRDRVGAATALALAEEKGSVVRRPGTHGGSTLWPGGS